MDAFPTCIVLDTETATVRAPHHLLELGAVRMEAGVVRERFESLVLPRVPIDPAASAVHGLVAEDVAAARDAGEVLAHFADWCAGARFFVAHNAPFDAAVLRMEIGRWGIALPDLEFLDTLRLARRAFPGARNHRLSTLAAELGFEQVRAHRALDDARTCARLLLACVERLGLDELERRGRCRARARAACPRGLPEHLAQLPRACLERRPLLLDYARGEPRERLALPVIPIQVFEQGGTAYLEGRCGRSGTWKTYRLDRVHALRALDDG